MRQCSHPALSFPGLVIGRDSPFLIEDLPLVPHLVPASSWRLPSGEVALGKDAEIEVPKRRSALPNREGAVSGAFLCSEGG
jgi:hypothetical protein